MPGPEAGADDKTKIVSFCLQRQRRIAAKDEAKEDNRVGSRTAVDQRGAEGGKSAHPSTGSVIELNGHTAREVSNVRVSLSISFCVCVCVG